MTQRDEAFVFVAEDAAGKLLPLASAHLRLGQFELARAALSDLSRCPGAAPAASARSFLRAVAEQGPPPSWLASQSVPSAAHLAWLCALAHDSMLGSAAAAADDGSTVTEQPIGNGLREETELEALLFAAFDEVLSGGRDVEWLEEFRAAASQKGGAGAPQQLSSVALAQLRALVARNPQVAARLTARILPRSAASPATASFSPVHRIWIDRSSSLLSAGRLAEAAASLAVLPFADGSALSAEDTDACRSLFLRFSALSDSLSAVQIAADNVYLPLLAAPTLFPLLCMCRASEEYLRNEVADSEHVLPLSFALLQGAAGFSEATSRAFWSHYALYTHATKVHFMEHTLMRAVALLKDGRLNDAALCMLPLGRLRPLLLLLGWDVRPQDSKFHSELLELLKPPESAESDHSERLWGACAQLAYNLRVSKWAAEKMLSLEANGQQADIWATTDSVMAKSSHTVPFVLSDLLGRIPVDEVTRMIEENPSPHATEAKMRDVTLVRSLAIMRRVLAFIDGRDSAEGISSDIEAISDAQSKVVLLQQIFCCLFLKGASTGEFRVTTEKAEAILKLVEDCLAQTPSQLAEKLRMFASEARKRLDIAKRLHAKKRPLVEGSALPSVLLRTLLAHPDDLEALAIQFGDFSLSADVEAAFNVAAGLKELSSVESASETAISALNSQQQSAFDALSVLETLPNAHAVVGDVAMRAGTQQVAKALLLRAAELAAAAGAQEFARVCTVVAEITEHAKESPAAAVSNPNLGTLAHTAEAQQRQMASLDSRARTNRLFLSVVNEAASNPTFDAEQATAALRLELSRLDDSSMDYIGAFLRHIMIISEVTAGSSMPQYFDVLERSPADIVRDLVFLKQNYDVAAKLAQTLGLDLHTTLIEEIAGPANAKPAGSGSQGLSLPVVEFIGRQWPATAMLMCLYAFPTTEFHPELVRFASAAVGTGPLRSWVLSMNKHFETFCRVFCQCTLGEAKGPILVDADGSEALRLLAQGSVDKFYDKVVSRLASTKDAPSLEALALADQMTVAGAPDALLLALARKGPAAEAWRFLLRVKDKSKAAPAVLASIRSWEVEICLNLLRMCAGLPEKDPSKAGVASALSKVQIFRDILALNATPHKAWPELDAECSRDAVPLIRSMLQHNRFDIARKLQAAFVVPNILDEIEESCLIHLLLKKDPSVVLIRLCELGSQAVETIEALIARLGTVDMNRTERAKASLFLVQFPLTNMRSYLKPDQLENFEQLEAGFQAFLLLPEELQIAYERLIKTPQLLLENMLIDRRIEEAAVLLRANPKLCDESLVISYAKKALVLHRRSGAADGPVMHRDLPPTAHFTGNPELDREVRSRHNFPNTPNVNLAKAIFDLGTDRIKVGNACLEVCNNLASGLTEQEPRAEETIDVVTRLLSYAKTVFQRDEGLRPETAKRRADGIMLCDSFLSAADMFGQLLRNRCAFGLSLHDILQTDKARWLRDRLIDTDLMNLAIDVAARCNLSAGKVWERWGFSMLSMGRYAEAREKFKFCMRGGRSFKRRGMFDDDPDPAELLQRIIEALTVEQEVDEAMIRSQLQQVLESVPKKASDRKVYYDTVSVDAYLQVMKVAPPKDEPSTAASSAATQSALPAQFGPPKLAEAVLAECVYYLKTYGAPRMLAGFYMQRGMVEEACRAAVEASLPPQAFVEEIVVHSLSHATLPLLQRSIRTVDPSFSRTKEYLLHTCKFFSKTQTFDILLDFQVFMGDFTRAGLTALHMFLEAEPMDFAKRITLLETARSRFEDALAAHSPDSVLSDADISVRLRGADTQVALIRLFQKHVKAIPPEVLKLSVFGNTRDRVALAEQAILLGNYDIAFRLVQQFRLPGGKLYTTTARNMARAKQASRIMDMLKHVKGTIPDREWDTVVLNAMQVFAKDHRDPKAAEKFLPKLVLSRSRVRGQALVGNLKAAYMAAVDENFVEEVQMIQREAATKDPKVASLCQRYLDVRRAELGDDAVPDAAATSSLSPVPADSDTHMSPPSPGDTSMAIPSSSASFEVPQSVGMGMSLRYGPASSVAGFSQRSRQLPSRVQSMMLPTQQQQSPAQPQTSPRRSVQTPGRALPHRTTSWSQQQSPPGSPF